MKKPIIISLLIISLVSMSLWWGFNTISIARGQEKSKTNEDIVIESGTDEPNVIESVPQEPKSDEEILIRYDSKNSIDMGVVFNNLIEDDQEYIIFNIRVNNHFKDLENIKYGELAILSFSDGTIIDDGFICESESKGHHISGKLKLPKNNMENKDFKELGDVQLDFEGVEGPEKMTFKWENGVVDMYMEK